MAKRPLVAVVEAVELRDEHPGRDEDGRPERQVDAAAREDQRQGDEEAGGAVGDGEHAAEQAVAPRAEPGGEDERVSRLPDPARGERDAERPLRFLLAVSPRFHLTGLPPLRLLDRSPEALEERALPAPAAKRG